MALSQLPPNQNPSLSRRCFLTGCASMAGLLVASPLFAAIPPSQEERSLAFRHTHTGERERFTYWRNGDYQVESLNKLNWLLRDHRTGETVQMDRALLDMLYLLQQSVNSTGEFEIISAYRSPKTNEMLRSKSGGVAKRSLHMQGRAIDIRLCGCDLKQLHNRAISLKAGGVGFYPKSDFIHIDTGRVRHW